MRFRIGYVVLVALAIAVCVAMSVVMGLASAFLIPPVLIAAGVAILFYWALRHQGVRNPLSPRDIGATGRWADGQPEHRALEHELQRVAIEELDRLEQTEMAERERAYERERAEVSLRTHPRDFEGPPPIVPFP